MSTYQTSGPTTWIVTVAVSVWWRGVGVVVVDGVGERVVAGEPGGRVVEEVAVGLHRHVVAPGTAGAGDRRRTGRESGRACRHRGRC